MDGTGLTRAYGNHITGTQSGACLVEKNLQLPVVVKVARTGCMRCTHTLHDAIRDGKKDIGLLIDTHDGTCTSNSLYAPSVTEEFMSVYYQVFWQNSATLQNKKTSQRKVKKKATIVERLLDKNSNSVRKERIKTDRYLAIYGWSKIGLFLHLSNGRNLPIFLALSTVK